MDWPHYILWRWLDRPGHEAARLSKETYGWLLEGAAVFQSAGAPCALAYRIQCDAAWRTVTVDVNGWVGRAAVGISISASQAGDWWLNGQVVPAVQGCVDIDLNFSPATNLLPIRRLALAVGGQGVVRAAWLRFPSFELEPLEQIYRRLGADRYRYESGGGSFRRDLTVDDQGFVVDYPGIWQREGAA